METIFTSKEEADKTRKWHIIDASGVTLGRLASEAAVLLRGKHKPTFTRNTDCGDFVIVINANKIKLTGNKLEDKLYYKHTGFIGNMKVHSAADLVRSNPIRMIEQAIHGMLPKGVLGRHMGKKLKVYVDDKHPHAAQRPEAYQPKYFTVPAAQ